MSKYGHKTGDWFDALANKLGGEEGAERFLRGETTVVNVPLKLREDNGLFVFDVTSDGTTGPEWLFHLREKGYGIPEGIKAIFFSPDFAPTSGVRYAGRIVRGGGVEISTEEKFTEFYTRHQGTPPEVACLLRKHLTDLEIEIMGLSGIIILHKPIKDIRSTSSMFVIQKGTKGKELSSVSEEGLWLWALERSLGFAYIVS